MGVFAFSTVIRGTKGNKLINMKPIITPIFALAVIIICTNAHGQSVAATQTNSKSSTIEAHKIERIPIKVIQSEKVEKIAEESKTENKKNLSLQKKTTAIEPKKQLTARKKDK